MGTGRSEISVQRMGLTSGRVIMAGEDWIVQEFDHRCPYCDEVIVYEGLPLKSGENEITCPSCQGVFIKVVGSLAEEEEIE